MAYDVIHKNSTVAGTPPTASEIEVGEVAINAADAELYVKDTNGNIRKFQNTTTGTADGVQFTQAGTGAVQRTVESKLQDVVSVKDFGAAGDAVTDDTAAIQAALNAADGRQVVFEGGKTYLISSAITLTGKDVSITSDGKPATIFLNGQSDNGLTIQNTAALTTSLSASTAKYSRTWTVPDASAVQPGMLMEIKSNVLWYYDPRGVAKKSELHLVQSVSGNNIQSYLPANDGYDTASETVTVTFYDPLSININNIKLKAVPQINPPSQKYAVRVEYALDARITDLVTEGFQATGLRLWGCYGAKVTRHTGIDCNYSATGYGAATSGCTNTTFKDCYYRGCRRGIDISGQEVISLHTLIEGCFNDGGGYSSTGAKWGFVDSGSAAGGAPNYGFGSHGPCDHATYKNNRTNAYFGINTRGGNEVIEGNEFYDHTSDCITLSYGANRIIKNNVSLPGLTDKDLSRYDGGGNINNFIPENFISVSDNYDGGSILEVSSNSGFVNNCLIEFASGAVVPTSGLSIKDNNIQFLIPSSTADNNILTNLNSSTDGARNYTPTVPLFLSGNNFTRSGTGELILANNITPSPITGNYQGTYTPTLTPVSNITSANVFGVDWRYSVSGNIVQVFGTFEATHTVGTTDSRMRISLPFQKSFATTSAGSGFAVYANLATGTDSFGQCSMDTTANEFELTFQATLAGSNVKYKFHGWYYMDL